MSNKESDKEIPKLKIKKLLKMLYQEIKNPKLGKSKEAKFWLKLFTLGIKNRYWKKEDNLEHVLEILKNWAGLVDESFEESLIYVI